MSSAPTDKEGAGVIINDLCVKSTTNICAIMNCGMSIGFNRIVTGACAIMYILN